MKNIHLHSVIIDSSTYDILSADTDFYGFIGRDKLYNTFEKFIHPDSRDLFVETIASKSTKPFIISMLSDDNQPISTYMKVSNEGTNLNVEFETVRDLLQGQESYKKYFTLAQDLLSLHNDIIFTYNKENNLVSFFTSNFKRCTKTLTLDEVINEIKSNIDKSEYEKLDRFIFSIQNDSNSFCYTFSGKIFSSQEDCKSSVVKGFCINDIDSISTIGYIHRTNNKTAASFYVEKDTLTGVYSKKEISGIAHKVIEVEQQQNVCICIIDIDYFKLVNDNFGHMMGDVILKEVANIISKEVGNMGDVGRFGGDEFLVIFYNVEDMELCREKLRSIKNIINTKYKNSDNEASVNITLSIGCSTYPKDADNYNDLFTLADFCLYKAKDKGRNRYIIYTPEKHGSLEEIKNYFNNNRRIDSRKDMAMGDVLCMIGDKHYNDPDYTPEMLIDDLVENLPFERIICLSGNPLEFKYMSGINLVPVQVIMDSVKILNSDEQDETPYVDDLIIINDVEILKNRNIDIYNAYKAMDIKAFIQVSFTDAAGKPSIVSLEMTTHPVQWNTNQLFNYRTIARMLSRYEL